jgi:WSC domain
MTCSGDSTAYCGAGNRLTVYIKNGTNSASLSSSSLSVSGSVSSQSSGGSSSASVSSKQSTSLLTLASTTQSSSSLSSRSFSSPSSFSSTSSAPMTSQTLAISRTVGKYIFQGCWTEGNGVRALSDSSFFNHSSMTLEMCGSGCSGFTYWGVEYGGECASSVRLCFGFG